MAPILSPAAKAEMDKLNREGDNIGSWGTGSARSHDIKFIYEAAEKCRAEGYRQYQNNNLRVAYVMFLRFAKFFDVIKSLPSLQPTSAAHKKCKVDLLNALTLMEEIKPKLLVKYGESPAAAATATAIAPRDEDVADLTKTLEERFNKLVPAVCQRNGSQCCNWTGVGLRTVAADARRVSDKGQIVRMTQLPSAMSRAAATGKTSVVMVLCMLASIPGTDATARPPPLSTASSRAYPDSPPRQPAAPPRRPRPPVPPPTPG